MKKFFKNVKIFLQSNLRYSRGERFQRKYKKLVRKSTIKFDVTISDGKLWLTNDGIIIRDITNFLIEDSVKIVEDYRSTWVSRMLAGIYTKS